MSIGMRRRGNGSISRGACRQSPSHSQVAEDSEAHSSGAATSGVVPRASIQSYCDAIAREFRPQRIVLFGSYAYGEPGADSDVDLMVIMPFRGNDLAKAIQIRSRFDTPFPLDLVVRKPEFIEARLRERDMFIELVMTRGHVIYESQHA